MTEKILTEEEIKKIRNSRGHPKFAMDMQERIYILCSSHEALRKLLLQYVEAWICEDCNTAFPRPHYEGFRCLECPTCHEAKLMPISLFKIRELEQQLSQLTKENEELKEMLEKFNWDNSAINVKLINAVSQYGWEENKETVHDFIIKILHEFSDELNLERRKNEELKKKYKNDGYCEVCFYSAWTPVPKDYKTEYGEPVGKDKVGITVRCDHCWTYGQLISERQKREQIEKERDVLQRYYDRMEDLRKTLADEP